MTQYQVVYLCDAYQEALIAEEKLKNILELLGVQNDSTIIDPITTNIFEAFMEVINYKNEEVVYECLINDFPQHLYDLQEDEFKN